MAYENAKLVLSGGAGLRPFFDQMFELAGTGTPQLVVDLSPRTDEAKFLASQNAWRVACEKLGLPDPLWLQKNFDDPLTRPGAESLLEKADVLLVSGGGTRQAYAKWQQAGITRLMVESVVNGEVVAAGGSAGAMIWFREGFSDSPSYDVSDGEYWEYEIIQGAGLFNGCITAHYSDTDAFGRIRSDQFKRALEARPSWPEVTIGLDTYAALTCTNGIAKVHDLSTPQKSGPHNVYLYHGIKSKTVVGAGEDFSLDIFRH